MAVSATEDGKRVYRVLAKTAEEEENFNYVQYRTNVKFTGLIGSVAHIVKGALGGGILGGHVAYKEGGWLVSVIITFLLGFYLFYCLYLLVWSAQILYKRTRIPSMSYSDVGEAALACFPNPKVAKFAKPFRYTIDAVISLDLFGSCACYQLIIAKSFKQLVENTQETSLEGKDGLPGLRVYLAAMIIPLMLICWITHLKYLAPFSFGANLVVLLCIGMSIYYAFEYNPTFENMAPVKSIYGTFVFIGMNVFSMSCAGIVIAIENNMREPHKFKYALAIGMSLIVLSTFLVSFFGYAAFLEKSDAPITINFPMRIAPKILKALIAFMIYVTHALNFWVPFNLCFYYIRRKHKSRLLMWEIIYRTICVFIISMVAIVFPDINALMGFLGAFCLSNMAFIWPNLICLLVVWTRPGLGKYNWRLWRALILMFLGILAFVCGSVVNLMELVDVFKKINMS